jgi:tripartite-type tricarboxylate transporter receptor subunit TctC
MMPAAAQEERMHRRHLLAGLASMLVAGPARAQIAEQPIRIVFPFAAGGVGDVLGRIMAEHLRAALNRPAIVENRTGAAGRLGVQAVKAAPPNGSVLLLTPIAPIAIYPHFYPQLEYDPFTDLEPLSQLATFEFALAVAKRVPAASLRELVNWLKGNPSEQNFATPGPGTLPYFFAQQFGKTSGLSLSHVSYRGSAAAVQDLVAGQIPLVVTSTSDFAEPHKAGLIRVLATSEKQPFIPGIPTFQEAGFDMRGNGWYAMYAPARTPAALLDQYSSALAAGVNAPETKERLIGIGF